MKRAPAVFAIAACVWLGCPAVPALADNYEADVRIEGEEHPLSVEIEAGEVAYLYWPGGGATPLTGAVLKDNGTAVGADPEGKIVEIKVDGYAKSAPTPKE